VSGRGRGDGSGGRRPIEQGGLAQLGGQASPATGSGALPWSGVKQGGRERKEREADLNSIFSKICMAAQKVLNTKVV
jgi:hypothetical protein